MDRLALAIAMRKVGELPALPHVTSKVLQLIDNPVSSSQDICKVLIRDQVLTAKVLRLVNSAYYGLPRKVSTITEAVALLGLQTLRTLVLGVSVYKALDGIGKGKVLSAKQIWQHSIASATASRLLAVKFGFIHIEQAFVAGLLHDIGKIVLNTVMAEEYQGVIKLVDDSDMNLLQAEKEVMDFDHSVVGSFVAQKWNLPDTLAEPIEYHHNPLAAVRNRELVSIVHLGNAAAIVAGFGLGNDKDFHLDNKVLNRLKFSFDQIVDLSSELSNRVTEEVIL